MFLWNLVCVLSGVSIFSQEVKLAIFYEMLKFSERLNYHFNNFYEVLKIVKQNIDIL